MASYSRAQMKKTTKQALIFGLGLVTIWDTFTTISGTSNIIGQQPLQIGISILFGLLIASLLLGTIPIMKNPREELVPLLAKFLWLLAVVYDLYTAFVGNTNFILAEMNSQHIQQIIIAAGLTLFVTACPIGISYLLYDVDTI